MFTTPVQTPTHCRLRPAGKGIARDITEARERKAEVLEVSGNPVEEDAP